MAVFLGAVGALSALILVALLIAFARRLTRLTAALAALQSELMPALDAIRKTSEETTRMATELEERARVLRRHGD